MNDKFFKELADRVVENVNNQKLENIRCDRCGSNKITEISYGLPGWLVIDEDYEIDPRITALLEERKIVLGGCCKDETSPKYFCRECGNKF